MVRSSAVRVTIYFLFTTYPPPRCPRTALGKRMPYSTVNGQKDR